MHLIIIAVSRFMEIAIDPTSTGVKRGLFPAQVRDKDRYTKTENTEC
jgi:hypothetical protein